MAFIKKDFIDKLMEKASLKTVMENAGVKLTRAGGNAYKACCPFHGEKNPSFYLDDAQGVYHCFSCNASGNVITFMKEYQRMEFPQLIEALARMENMEVEYEESARDSREAELAAKRKAELQADLEFLAICVADYRSQLEQSVKAKNYLRERGVNLEMQELYQIGYAPPVNKYLYNKVTSSGNQGFIASMERTFMAQFSEEQNTWNDFFYDRIMFPIFSRDGKVVGFGGRALNPNAKAKYKNSRDSQLYNKSNELYGLYQVKEFRKNNRTLSANSKQKESIILVEGYLDVISLAQFGLIKGVAASGTSITQQQLLSIFRETDNLVCCFDGDRAGHDAAYKASKQALSCLENHRTVSVVFLPDGEDPDSFLQKRGQATFVEYLKTGKDIITYLIDKEYELAMEDAPNKDAAIRNFIGQMAAHRYAIKNLASNYTSSIRSETARKVKWSVEEVSVIFDEVYAQKDAEKAAEERRQKLLAEEEKQRNSSQYQGQFRRNENNFSGGRYQREFHNRSSFANRSRPNTQQAKSLLQNQSSLMTNKRKLSDDVGAFAKQRTSESLASARQNSQGYNSHNSFSHGRGNPNQDQQAQGFGNNSATLERANDLSALEAPSLEIFAPNQGYSNHRDNRGNREQRYSREQRGGFRASGAATSNRSSNTPSNYNNSNYSNSNYSNAENTALNNRGERGNTQFANSAQPQNTANSKTATSFTANSNFNAQQPDPRAPFTKDSNLNYNQEGQSTYRRQAYQGQAYQGQAYQRQEAQVVNPYSNRRGEGFPKLNDQALPLSEDGRRSKESDQANALRAKPVVSSDNNSNELAFLTRHPDLEAMAIVQRYQDDLDFRREIELRYFQNFPSYSSLSREDKEQLVFEVGKMAIQAQQREEKAEKVASAKALSSKAFAGLELAPLSSTQVESLINSYLQQNSFKQRAQVEQASGEQGNLEQGNYGVFASATVQQTPLVNKEDFATSLPSSTPSKGDFSVEDNSFSTLATEDNEDPYSNPQYLAQFYNADQSLISSDPASTFDSEQPYWEESSLSGEAFAPQSLGSHLASNRSASNTGAYRNYSGYRSYGDYEGSAFTPQRAEGFASEGSGFSTSPLPSLIANREVLLNLSTYDRQKRQEQYQALLEKLPKKTQAPNQEKALLADKETKVKEDSLSSSEEVLSLSAVESVLSELSNSGLGKNSLSLASTLEEELRGYSDKEALIEEVLGSPKAETMHYDRSNSFLVQANNWGFYFADIRVDLERFQRELPAIRSRIRKYQKNLSTLVIKFGALFEALCFQPAESYLLLPNLYSSLLRLDVFEVITILKSTILNLAGEEPEQEVLQKALSSFFSISKVYPSNPNYSNPQYSEDYYKDNLNSFAIALHDLHEDSLFLCEKYLHRYSKEIEDPELVKEVFYSYKLLINEIAPHEKKALTYFKEAKASEEKTPDVEAKNVDEEKAQALSYIRAYLTSEGEFFSESESISIFTLSLATEAQKNALRNRKERVFAIYSKLEEERILAEEEKRKEEEKAKREQN